MKINKNINLIKPKFLLKVIKGSTDINVLKIKYKYIKNNNFIGKVQKI